MSGLCEFAKNGQCCWDDLCHGADVTLCGFDKEEYEAETLCEVCGQYPGEGCECYPAFDDDDDQGPVAGGGE